MKVAVFFCAAIATSLAYGLHGQRKKRSVQPDAVCSDKSAVCDLGTGEVCQSRLTEAEKEEIRRAHNVERGKENGRNLFKLKWDDGLADLAQAWADQCTFGHGFTNRCDKNGDCGQNIYYGMTFSSDSPAPVFDGTTVVELWYNEKSHYTYGAGCQPGEVCGHYTQVVWAKTSKVGCAYTQCPKAHVLNDAGEKVVWWSYPTIIVVCNYDPPGNWIGENPFEQGTPCTDCASVATKGYVCDQTADLCVHCTKETDPGCTCACSGSDCCLNGGVYNAMSCQCDCPAGLVGDKCESSCSQPTSDCIMSCFHNSCPGDSCLGYEDLIISMCADMCPPVLPSPDC